EISDDAEIDRSAASKACRIKPDRDQPGAGGGALAELVAEVEKEVRLARVAHVAQERADEKRMLGRGRARPVAERKSLAGYRHAKELGELKELLLAAAPGDLVADADQWVACLEQRARGLLDVILVGPDAHRHVELGLVPDRGLRLSAQDVGRQR